MTAPANARASAPTVVAATAAVVVVATAPKAVQKGARKDALRAARTLEQKVVQRDRAATNAANATPRVVLKASARNARWVKAANPASIVSRVAKAATRHVRMSAWTPAPKAGRKVSPARSHANPAPSQAAAAANVPRAVATVLSHALKPANPVVNVLSVTLSSKTWHWPTKQPWPPQ